LGRSVAVGKSAGGRGEALAVGEECRRSERRPGVRLGGVPVRAKERKRRVAARGGIGRR
jgi:hypothetical protein